MKLSIVCDDCSNISRIESVNPIGGIIPKVCPYCGSKAISVHKDNTLDYFDLLAETFGLPTYIIKEIYSVWDVKEYPSFSDFVRSLENDAA